MRTKFNGILTLLLALSVQFVFAQKTVSGTVSDETGPLPGVSVLIKGTKTGTETDFDGKYSLQAKQGDILQFSYVGMTTVEKTVGTSNVIDVVMVAGDNMLDEVVITALGIPKEKKSLGYATQSVKGDDIAGTSAINFADALSGEVAGLNIQSYGNMGGSANMIVRGYKSLYGSNQALVIIDGTPVLNDVTNSSNVATGRGGYDYGNAAMDINPDDIESVNVLKGAAASALYGSRANNGVIMITTKKGKKNQGMGISVTSGITLGRVDKETLPVYQNQYGAGYGLYYGENGDQYFDDSNYSAGDINDVVPFREDASYGAAFDPNKLVYQWYSLYPELPGYMVKTPWVAVENNPNYIWQTAMTTNNSISFGKSNENSSFRIGYTNKSQDGVLPNSSIKKNTLTFAASQDFGPKTKGSVDFSYTNTKGKGRNGTGYSGQNPMQAFRQWFQTNVDLKQQKDAFFNYGQKNYTWNAKSLYNTEAAYTDNVYWTLYKNYETDSRDRYMGNFSLSQEITSWFNVSGRFSFDAYGEIREERIDVGSNDTSQYIFRNNKVSEFNYDLMGNFNKDFSSDFNVNGLIGFNLRVNKFNGIAESTNGGLITPGLFTLTNSVSSIGSDNIAKTDYIWKNDGIYGKVGLSYKGTYYLDGTLRRDRSSALPSKDNTYYYPSVSGSIVFSNLIKNDWLSFGKIRANWAKVGSDTSPYSVFASYDINTSFDGVSSASNPSTFNNLDLQPEFSYEKEIGLELQLFKNRLGFDLSFYDRLSKGLITPVSVPAETGVTALWKNSGDISNKGVELVFNVTPVKTDKFSWDLKFNYAKNISEVKKIYGDSKYLQLASAQGGISVGAQLGEPFGVIRGKDFIYDQDGNKVVTTTGAYAGFYRKTTTSNYVIGNINPDWTGGVKNSFKYGNFDLGFLIDVQKGGDIYSLDSYYGSSTGLYAWSVENNDLGNPMRNSLEDGGGVIVDGVLGTVVYNSDGTYEVSNTSPNTIRVDVSSEFNPWGYYSGIQAQHIYDASFVKLREVTFGYRFSKKVTDRLSLDNLSLSFVGKNLWIIHKNIPYADPEAGLGAGNIQGFHSGAYPSVKEYGANLKFNF